MDITARAATKKDMENIIREIRALLNDKMDLSMNSIKKSEPEFFNTYTSARVTVDLKGKRSVKQPVSDTTGMISGTVTDSETGDPIADAIVQLEGTEEATTTDEDGVFIFDTVTAGPVNIVCTKELYKNLNLAGIVVKAGEETEVEGVMEKESA
jgi:protocatechuate 3,4-dioxygenase beta subunit